MADTENKWALNLDKIAYGVAGLVGLIVLSIPLLFSGEDRSNTVLSRLEDLKSKAEDQPRKLPKLDPLPLSKIAEDQWTAGPSLTLDPDWSTEREQIFLKKIKKGINQLAVHDACVLAEITCQRDPAKRAVYLQVKGAPSPKNEHVVIKKVELLRKEGDGEFAPVATLTPSSELVHKDETVAAGKTYTYKLRTTAVKDPKAPDNVTFDEKEAVKESEPLGPTKEVPYEFSLHQIQINNPEEPKFFARLIYWDYKKGEAAGGQLGKLEEFKEKDFFAEARYRFFLVLPGDGKEGKVVVQEVVTNEKDTITTAQKNPRPVAAWKPLTPGGGEEPEEAPEPDVEPPAKDKDKAKAKAKPVPKASEKSKTPEKKTGTKKTDTKSKTDTKTKPKKKGFGGD